MQVAIGDFSGVCISSVCTLLQRVTRAIAQQRPNFVKMPSTEAEMIAASEGFYVFARFPLTMKITNIVARWPGASHDQTIFNNSNLKMQLERGDFGNFIIVGDSGYRNTRYLATPILNCESAVHQLYNESQIRTRNVIERTIGVLKRLFPVLSMGNGHASQIGNRQIDYCRVCCAP